MDEPQYVIFEQCSPFASQGNDVHKTAITSDSSQIASTSSSSLTSYAYILSSSGSNNILPKTSQSMFIKEGVQTLPQEVLEPKFTGVSHLNILQSNVLNNSSISLQGDTLLSEESKAKFENGNEVVIANSYCGTSDNGPTGYRLLLASLPYSSLIKNNLSYKNDDQALFTSSLPSPDNSNNETDETIRDKSEPWSNNDTSSLVLNASSSLLKDKKGSAQSHVVVKLLQDDLNFDMVEIISPNLDNSQIFEIIEKDNEINKVSLNKELTNELSSNNLKFIATNEKGYNQEKDGLSDIAQNSLQEVDSNCSVFYTCSLCNKIFTSETGCHEHTKVCLSYSSSSNSTEKNFQVQEENETVFSAKNSMNDKKRRNPSKTDLVWMCLICSQEYPHTVNLKIHYVSHTIEELATALLKCTFPTSSRNKRVSNLESKSNNANNPILNQVEKNIKKLVPVAPSGDDKKELSNAKNKEDTVHSRPDDEDNDHIKLLSTCKKNKSCSKPKKTKSHSKTKAKPGLKSRDPHACPVCNKFLSSRGNLAKHLIQHEVVKPWVCKVCGLGFNSKRNHDYHYMQRHTTLRPSVCNICGKGYTNKRTLTEHMVFHQKEREFKCELCGKAFRTKKCVTRHMLRHETNRKFVCDLCFKGFRVKIDLLTHLKLVHNSDKRKSKNKLPNFKSQSLPVSCIPDQFSQTEANLTNRKLQTDTSPLTDHQQMAITHQPLPLNTNTDDMSKIRDLSDLLQTQSNTILSNIGDESHSANLSTTKCNALTNDENIKAQANIPVTSAAEENSCNNSYNLTIHNKHAMMNSDLVSSGTYVVIGLADLQAGADNSWEKTAWHTLNEYKAGYQETSLKEVLLNYKFLHFVVMQIGFLIMILFFSLHNSWYALFSIAFILSDAAIFK